LKTPPEEEKNDIKNQINKFGSSKLHEIIEGRHYRENYEKVFGEVRII
jgi:hypothetical protein